MHRGIVSREKERAICVNGGGGGGGGADRQTGREKETET